MGGDGRTPRNVEVPGPTAVVPVLRAAAGLSW
jgi:hypothetical protein